MSVNYTAISIAFSAVKGLAGILTLFRLGFRLKIRRLWWEDFWATVALVCTMVSIFTVVTVSRTTNARSILIASKINAYMFTCVVWSVRLSLISAIIRITYTPLQRRITLTAAAFFTLFWATTLCLQAWRCADDTGIIFAGTGRTACVLPRFVIILEVAMNCSADTASVIFPIRLLWRVKLPGRQRRMLLSLFTTSRFLCGFALAHSISQLVGKLPVQVILAEIQMAVFLIICNLLVVITYFYRTLQSSSQREPSTDPSTDPLDDDFTTPALRNESTTQHLTTVDLSDSLHTGTSETASELKELKDPMFPFIAHSTDTKVEW
ncbi:hypothetical protein V8E55_008220 [Tylopilus felleus]